MIEDPRIKDSINRYINHIRTMAALSDDEMRLLLIKAAEERPEIFAAFSGASMKRDIAEMKKMAKDVHGDPIKFARKVV